MQQAVNPQEKVVAKVVDLFANQLSILSQDDGRVAVRLYEKAKMYTQQSTLLPISFL
jgi:hypothetical protein